MPNPEPRYPCPVCLGVQMVKQPIGQAGELLLDHCQRCGGIWFDSGEVEQLRGYQPQALWRRVALRPVAEPMQCHGCHVPIGRNEPTCPACEWHNVIPCPVCQQPLQPTIHRNLLLDICPTCKGVWFDHLELAEIWNLALASAIQEQRPIQEQKPIQEQPPFASPSSLEVYDDAGPFLLDLLEYNPELIIFGARAVGQAGQRVIVVTAEVLAQAPEAVGSAMEEAGELATTVFETIAAILTDLFP
jgi:uncharacterized protein